jgi:hypothetical protein
MKANKTQAELNNYKFYLEEIKPFVDKSVLSSFSYIASELVRRGKIGPNDLKIKKTSPWLLVDDSTDLDIIYPAFAIHANFKLTSELVNGAVVDRMTRSPIRDAKTRMVLVEQRIWESIVLCLLLSRGVSRLQLRVVCENLSYLIGYLQGVNHMDEYGDKHAVGLAEEPSLNEALAKARRLREAPIDLRRQEFCEWAASRLKEGDLPSTIRQVMALPGFKPEWGSRSDDSFRKLARRGGFKLKGGRPPKK